MINLFENKLESARHSIYISDGIESSSDCLIKSHQTDDNRSTILNSVDRSKVCSLPKRNGTVRRLVWF